MKKEILWIEEVKHSDEEEVGSGVVHLAEARKLGVEVANGFVVTADAAKMFFEETGLLGKINGLLAAHAPTNEGEVKKIYEKIHHLITHTDFPEELGQQIMLAYVQLAKHNELHLMTMRAVMTAKSLEEKPYIGQIAHLFNLHGEANVAVAVRECWSLGIERLLLNIGKNLNKHFTLKSPGIAIFIQEMVSPDVAGLLLTRNPEDSTKKTALLEAVYGHPEVMHHESLSPDIYVVNVDAKEISKQVHPQTHVYQPGKDHHWHAHELGPHARNAQKVGDEMILKIAEFGKKLAQEFKQQLEIDWALVDGKLLILHVKIFHPQTTAPDVKKEEQAVGQLQMTKKLHVLARGLGVRKGVHSGYVHVMKHADDGFRIPNGAIVVASFTTSEFVPFLRHCGALVVEEDGHASHSAMLARELGIPCVVGVDKATKLLQTRAVLTVDGGTGTIYQGSLAVRTQKQIVRVEPVVSTNAEEEKIDVVTATGTYGLLLEDAVTGSEQLEACDGLVVDTAFSLGKTHIHPQYALDHGLREEYVRTLGDQLLQLCEQVNPDSVMYQLPDWTSDEYRKMTFGAQYEPVEVNPWLGVRGTRRWLAYPHLLELELDVVKYVRNKSGLRNLHVMVTYCRTAAEYLELKKQIATYGLTRSGDFKLWLRVDTPLALQTLGEFGEMGVDGFAFDVHRLWTLMSGYYTQAPHASYPAGVWKVVMEATKVVRKQGLETMLLQRGSLDQELTTHLLQAGLRSLAMPPENLVEMKSILQAAENKIIVAKEGEKNSLSTWH